MKLVSSGTGTGRAAALRGGRAHSSSSSAATAALHRRRCHGRRQQGSGLANGAGGRLQTLRVAAVSSPERLTVTDRTPAPPPPEVEVKVIGIGGRGASAISKLVQHGKVGARAAAMLRHELGRCSWACVEAALNPQGKFSLPCPTLPPCAYGKFPTGTAARLPAGQRRRAVAPGCGPGGAGCRAYPQHHPAAKG